MVKNSLILEGCVDSVLSAKNATEGGANRLELCSNLIIGGTSPSTVLFKEVRKKCHNTIHVLIRPRFGDFCYDEDEFSVMLNEVKEFRQLGADGVVIGNLLPNGDLNLQQTAQLKDAAGNMSVTLHRAFDVCRDPIKTMQEAIGLGINSILTSGQQDTCLQGKECIRNLVKESAGTIEILVGTGVNADVIRRLRIETAAKAFHMSGKKTIESKMQFRNPDVHMGIASIDEYEMLVADKDEFIRAARELRYEV